MKRLLEQARIVDPASGRDEVGDLLIEDGKIVAVDRRIESAEAARTNLSGKVVTPGLFDMHVHFREPGQEWKETVASGVRAAARGGFTRVACMPNTIPVNDSRSVTEMIVKQAREAGPVHVMPIGCITKGQKGNELAEMEDMRQAGACAFSDDGKPVLSSLIMRRALEYSKVLDTPIIDHCEDSVLVDGGVMNEGELSVRLGLRGWPSVAEDLMVQRDILLADYTRSRVHIAHMSTARSAEFVRDAKARGIGVTCEVTPHHLVLTDAAVAEYVTDAKMNPPLRSAGDVEGLIEALADGTVDAIATDHAPHHCDEKCVEFSLAPFGVVGLETAVSIVLDRLVHTGRISLLRMVELLTTGPARSMGIETPSLAPGRPADLTVLDLERSHRVDVTEFESKSENTPFRDWELRGAPLMTIVAGETIHSLDGQE